MRRRRIDTIKENFPGGGNIYAVGEESLTQSKPQIVLPVFGQQSVVGVKYTSWPISLDSEFVDTCNAR